MNRKLVEAEKNLNKAQEEAQRSAAEMERLLQLVQMSQEEQNAKEKTIMELQQYVLDCFCFSSNTVHMFR